MSPHDLVDTAAVADEEGSKTIVPTGSERSRGHSGKFYAVPAGDVVGSSGRHRAR